MTLRLNLGRYLQEHDISAYRLVQEVKGRVAPGTVYSLARKPAQRIDLDTVAKILQALERVRGQKVEITEMLEDTPDAMLTTPPVYDASNRKVFKYNGYRATVAPGPSAQEILDDLRGHTE
ncbi:XRE-family like protein, component of toxin-antitoxin system [Deinococcus aerius]|uniref:XRE-family like protein, component of toxin-antitoxin system n=1 Tax=Deinococcus aerius TaxID=200253 RepID=A0A2I9CYI2_9DEIO|nr:helix-turn-helix transcriptional regulator [Deinococcus aerius]GBF07209.1 XRE-family like protein, component of toxin-antitoxin system [Deinococcus aerius]